MIYGSEDLNRQILKLITNPDDDNCKFSGYKECCCHADDMSVHLYGSIPIKILNRVRPREDPETKQYRIDSYEPTTKSTADKGLSIISKIFNPSLYSIRWPESNKRADQLKKWTMTEYPYNQSIINYVQEVGLRKMIADPNAVFAVKPNQYPVNDQIRIQPIIKTFGSKNIWWKDQDGYLIFVRKDEINKQTVYYFEWYGKTEIMEFYAYTTNGDLDKFFTKVTQKYNHNFGEVPVWELKGNTEVQDNGTELHKSFFEPALPFWNMVISHQSDLTGAFINHIHPIRIELAEECDFVDDKGQRCRSGWIVSPDDGNKSMCRGCNGTGHKSVKSPYGVYRIDHDKLSGENKGSIAPVSFATVPTDATDMLDKYVEKLLEKGLYALNMDVLNKIGENQSGKAKVIDRGELYDFLYKISSVVFNTHIYNIFKYCNWYMFGVEALNPTSEDIETNMPNINAPTMFDITTAVEMVQEYKNSKDAGINPHYLRAKQMQLNAKEFASDEELACMLNLILECDPIPQIPDDTIIANALEGYYKPLDPIIHANIGVFVKRAIEEYPEGANDSGGFENMTQAERYKILEGYAQEIQDANNTVLGPDVLSTQFDANGKPINPEIDPNSVDATQAATAKTNNQRVITKVLNNAMK